MQTDHVSYILQEFIEHPGQRNTPQKLTEQQKLLKWFKDPFCIIMVFTIDKVLHPYINDTY